MTTAMMLPSTLPLVRLFVRASREQPQPRLVLLTFLGAYIAVWTGFAIVAFVGDMALHWLVYHWFWLHRHPWIIAGSTLPVIGIAFLLWGVLVLLHPNWLPELLGGHA